MSMKDIRLFNCSNYIEVTGDYSYFDNAMLDFIKKHTELFFNIKLLAAEYKIGRGGEIDMLALDGIFSPVVILFQKAANENIIAKGLFCLDWITQHRSAFNELVSITFPGASKEKINWTDARLLCISGDFSKYDKYFVSQINRNVELIRYRKYPDSLLLFEVVNELDIRESLEKLQNQRIGTNDSFAGQERNEGFKKNRPISTISRIGYCNIKNDEHYAVFPNKEAAEIIDIPSTVYLAQGQFVLIDEYGCFKYVFPYGIGDNELNQSVSSFAVVNINETGIFIEKGDNMLKKLDNIPASIQLRDKNIVSVDSQNRFIRFYKPIKHNADSFMASAKAKGHQMVFVLKMLQDGSVLRDIETGKEFCKNICSGNITVKENQVVCLQDDKVVTAFNSSKFYTLSSYYDNFEYGTVEIKDGLVFLRKLTGEKVIIKDAPEYLRSGQVVYVDENNNFCGIEDNGEGFENDTIKRNVTNIRTYRKISRNEKIEVIKKVLILGNNSYANSYKLSLLKYGYKAEVLEGFEPWTRINSELKETDVVVVITSHMSHDNMWRIKKEVNDIPVIYSEFDGANRILEQILNQEQKVHLPVTVEA